MALLTQGIKVLPEAGRLILQQFLNLRDDVVLW